MERLIKPVVLLDADVLINWFTKEVDPVSNSPLWEAPFKIIESIENDEISGAILLTTLLEIRFVLRRKKDMTESAVEQILEQVLSILDIYLPDEITLMKANQLQAKHPLSPFDAILLASALSLGPTCLILRDKHLLKIANNFLMAMTPEQFLSTSS